MSHFYAEIQGSRGAVTRCGSKNTGAVGHLRGWTSGVRVVCEHDPEHGDVFRVYETGGSNRPESRRLVAVVSEQPIPEEL